MNRSKGKFNRLIFAPIARRVKRFEAIFPKKRRSAYPLQTRKGEQGYKTKWQRGRASSVGVPESDFSRRLVSTVLQRGTYAGNGENGGFRMTDRNSPRRGQNVHSLG